jgi:SNF family Na+-dependent transporter
LKFSDGIENLGGLNWPIAGCLLAAWIIVLLALSKGVASLGRVAIVHYQIKEKIINNHQEYLYLTFNKGKISYFTATFPYIILTILVIKGFTLDGAGEGLEVYITQFQFERFKQPELWKDAVNF